MDSKGFIEEVKTRLAKRVLDVEEHNPLRITVSLDPKALKEAAELVFDEMKFRFIIASAMDTREGYEIFYHFSNDSTGHVVNLYYDLVLAELRSGEQEPAKQHYEEGRPLVEMAMWRRPMFMV